MRFISHVEISDYFYVYFIDNINIFVYYFNYLFNLSKLLHNSIIFIVHLFHMNFHLSCYLVSLPFRIFISLVGYFLSEFVIFFANFDTMHLRPSLIIALSYSSLAMRWFKSSWILVILLMMAA
jgi:hypothetical protein